VRQSSEYAAEAESIAQLQGELEAQEQLELLNEVVRQKDLALAAKQSEIEVLTTTNAAPVRHTSRTVDDAEYVAAAEKIAQLQDELEEKTALLAARENTNGDAAVDVALPTERSLTVTSEGGVLGIKFEQREDDDDTGPYVIVKGLRPGGPAMRSGLSAGDIVLSVEDDDTESVCHIEHLTAYLNETCQGDGPFRMLVSQMSPSARVQLAKRHANNAA
jgi:C-terminal processing protease CtpA/Prc